MTERIYPAWGERVFWDHLPNGLTLAVVPKPGFQKKLAYFVTDYGAIHRRFTLDGVHHQTPAGVAHYLEHKMFDLPRGEVSEEFAALGANPNAFTGYDMTAYYFSCTENFEACLRLLLEFVSTPYFTSESVGKEQGIIAQEIDMTADSPDTRVFEQLMTAMYPAHPIRTPILGDRESIGRITAQTLYDCHKAFYTPGNMMLCVVGDVDAHQVAAMAQEMLTPSAPAVKDPLPQEEMTCAIHEVSCSMEVAMPMFQLGFKCQPAPLGEAAVRQEIVGDLAAEALFGESSRLYLHLYEEGIIDTSFGGGFETVDGMSMLTASGDCYEPETVRQAILEEAQRLVREGIGQEDFLRMKRSALGRRIRELDSFDSTCFRLCAYYFSGFDYFEFPTLFAQVQEEEILDFIGKVVTPERCCLSRINKLEKEEESPC